MFFTGKKDFSFIGKKAKESGNTLCALKSIKILRKRGVISIVFRGDRFLWNMARNIVNALVMAGSGKISIGFLRGIIDKSVVSPILRKSAPPHGLFLKKIFFKKSLTL